MRHRDVVEGEIYVFVRRKRAIVVQIIATIPHRLGWIGRNMATGHTVYIRSPVQLHPLTRPQQQ